MKCPVCNHPTTENLHTRAFNSTEKSICFVVHPIFGVPLNVCPACQLIFVHFIHPDILSRSRTSGANGWKASDTVEGSDPHAHAPHLPDKINRLLVFSSADLPFPNVYQSMAKEIVVADPVCIQGRSGPFRMIDARTLGNSEWVGAFDAVIIDQSFCFITLPQYWLGLMSRILRADGVLSMQLTNLPRSDVENGAYDIRCAQFFSVETLQALVAHIPTFKTTHIGVGDDGMLTMQLVNEKTAPETPTMNIDPSDIMEAISTMSFSCFMTVNRAAAVGRAGNQIFNQADSELSDPIADQH